MLKRFLMMLSITLTVQSVLSQVDTVFYREMDIEYSILKSEIGGNEVLESYKNDSLDGLTVVLDGNHVVSISTYKNGIKDGYRYGFDRNGKLETVTLYVNGKSHFYCEFHSNGTKKYEHVENESDCYSKFWDDAGKLLSEGRCKK